MLNLLPLPARAAAVTRGVGRFLALTAGFGVLSLPIVVEQTIERTSYRDSIGSLPVEMTMCREGRSTLETGVLGDLHWAKSGTWGFGVRARVTGPPVAGGTLASYADRRFLQANLQFIEDPEAATSAYVARFADLVTVRVVTSATAIGVFVAALALLLSRFVPAGGPPGRRRLLTAGTAVTALVLTTAAAAVLFHRWPCNGNQDAGHPFPGIPELAFSSPQTRELALQVRPFLDKNTARIRERSQAYTAATRASFAEQLALRGEDLRPRPGELVVSAEADPQGAFVGAEVRRSLYALLRDELGADGLALRTISGDITSNGTVVEDDFVAAEVAAADGLPTVAVAGDHDSVVTHDQMREHGMLVPDLSTETVAGVRVSGANDVEHKALFGQLVTNESGITEAELGARLREQVSPAEAGIVLLHQPEAAAGYLGVDSTSSVREAAGSLTTPYDDGVPDVPPGTVNIGHLHDPEGPWVLWNTDGDEVTWTVVDQLGTTGGVEETPTFNRFSTPVSVPLKPIAWRLQYVDRSTGLQTGFVSISCDTEGACRVAPRVDVGLPLGSR